MANNDVRVADQLAPQAVTYSFSVNTAGVAGDTLVLSGNASNVVRVTRVEAAPGAETTAASDVIVTVLKRTTADTGGTAAAQTPAQYDSASAPSASVLNLYSAAPTPGTGIQIRGGALYKAISGTPTIEQNPIQWQFGDDGAHAPVVLRGIAQQVAINLSAPFTGGSAVLTIEWTESAT